MAEERVMLAVLYTTIWNFRSNGDAFLLTLYVICNRIRQSGCTLVDNNNRVHERDVY